MSALLASGFRAMDGGMLMPRTYQSKGFVCKTVSRDVLSNCIRFVEGVAGARWAYALHEPAPPKVPHWHFVGLFEDRVFWRSVYDFAMAHDPCSSTDTCKKPRKAVRYLLHLDSPDKHPVPRDALVSGGCWGPDELEDWLESSSVASSLVDTCLSLWRDGLSPLEALSRLVSYGFEPFQISASLQAYSRICEFWIKYAPSADNTRGMGAVSRPHQGIHGAPLHRGEESKDSDIQGQKTRAKESKAGKGVFRVSRSENQTANEVDSGTQDEEFPACSTSLQTDFPAKTNHAVTALESVAAVFGPDVGLLDFFPSNFSRLPVSRPRGK